MSFWLVVETIVLFVAPVMAQALEVRLVSILPLREGRGNDPGLYVVTVETTPGAECAGLVSASRVGYQSGSAQLRKLTASSAGRAGWLFFAPAAGFYTIAITCTVGELQGRLVTSFSIR